MAGDPRYRPVAPAPRECDWGRTDKRPAQTCPNEGLHRWTTRSRGRGDSGGYAPETHINLCDPHDKEARRMVGDDGQTHVQGLIKAGVLR